MGSARADTLNVPAQFATIQAAIDAAEPGAEILVAPGLYHETVDLRGKDIELRSTAGAWQTLIDGSGFFTSTVTCDGGEGPTTLVDGFTITGGESFFGGGIIVQGSSPTIVNCVLIANDADTGGAVHVFQGSPAIVNCLMLDNTAVSGGALAVDGGSPALVNCTLVRNAVMPEGTFGAAVTAFEGAPSLFNCVVWDNGSVELSTHGEAILTVQHSIVEGGWKGPGFAIMDGDPLFVDPDGGDFSLQPFSPAVDAGFTAAVPEIISADLHGFPRFVDDAGVVDSGPGLPPVVDLGALERQETSLHVPGLYASVQEAIDAATDGQELLVGAGVYAELVDFSGKAVTLTAWDGPGQTVLDGSGLGGSVVRFGSGEGPGSVLDGFTITGGSGTPVEIEPGVFEVRGGGILIDGASPIVTGCNVTGNGGAGVLGGGGYVSGGAASFLDCTFEANMAQGGGGLHLCRSGTQLVGSRFTGNDALADGGGVSVTQDSAARIIGCRFEANAADGAGGGVHCAFSRVTFDDAVFLHNVAERGGGLAVEGSGSAETVASRCRFHGNEAVLEGGGAYALDSELIVASSVFSGNAATDGGGLLSQDSSTEIISCTFSANQATSSGGAVAALDGAALTGCILWGNLAGGEVQPLGIDGSTLIGHCDIEGSGGSGPGWDPALGIDLGGNIDADPMFVDADGPDGVAGTEDDDLRPTPSPVIDAGSNDTPPDRKTDLGGGPRVLDGDLDGAAVVDMGAWELDPEGPVAIVRNQTTGGIFPSVAAALAEATDGDQLLANAAAFALEPLIDFEDRAVTLRSTADIVQPSGGLYVLANGVRLATDGMGIVQLDGGLRVPVSSTCDVLTSSFSTSTTTELTVETAATLTVEAPTIRVRGTTSLDELATWSASADPVENTGLLRMGSASSVVVESLHNEGDVVTTGAAIIGAFANAATGSYAGHGEIVGTVLNDGSFTCTGPTAVVGTFENHGTIVVSSGVLSIIGDLLDSGSTLGDVGGSVAGAGPPEAGDGLLVVGDYAAGTGASLLMPDPLWLVTIRGNVDLAINDAARFDLAAAELAVSAAPAEALLEVLSIDEGATSAGLDRGQPDRFPIGTLRLGPGPVRLVDAHDNALADGGAPEALYVHHLVIVAETALTTDGRRIYYRELVIEGTVDAPEQLVPIPDCPEDIDGNGAVDVDDLIAVILAWGDEGDDLPADVNGDGTVDVDDLVAVILAWGDCP